MVITTYNEEAFIREALESMLKQTLSDFEIVIVDDGSEDSTKEILAEYEDSERIRIFYSKHIGRSGALNTAIDEARGEYIAVVDPDDLSEENRLEVQAAYLDDHPDVGIVGSAYVAKNEIRSESYIREYPTDDAAIRRAMAKYIPIPHSSIMARRKALIQAGLYDGTRRAIVDLDLMIRVAVDWKVANLPEPLITRSIRKESSFHSMFSSTSRHFKLFGLHLKAVRLLELPRHYYLYALGHLLYHFFPKSVKKQVRRLFADFTESETR
ncbi:glycosyltransferase family 2 protein [Natronobacterium haloterrestre]|uniref:glycosyltransferase family 2 protein n=1 Tax=Natronobacterium haloterrestre TaxID=148448 RepID=UPI0015A51A57|nr:glycosyltransferase family 2 protein [Halobiforma haloterrestris]